MTTKLSVRINKASCTDFICAFLAKYTTPEPGKTFKGKVYNKKFEIIEGNSRYELIVDGERFTSTMLYDLAKTLWVVCFDEKYIFVPPPTERELKQLERNKKTLDWYYKEKKKLLIELSRLPERSKEDDIQWGTTILHSMKLIKDKERKLKASSPKLPTLKKGSYKKSQIAPTKPSL